MITLSTASHAVSAKGSMAAVYIAGFAVAYGDVPFIRYYCDEAGNHLAIMDEVGYLHTADSLTDEWLQFLSLVPDMHCVYTTVHAGERIARYWEHPMHHGLLLEAKTPIKPIRFTANFASTVSAKELYSLLSANFSPFPSFESWYVDFSHRVRHGCCHVAVCQRDDRYISCAMTVAEAPDAFLIGGVCTLPSYRRQGYAQQCIQQLRITTASTAPDKPVFLAMDDLTLLPFYEAQGFYSAGEWASVDR